MLEYINKSYRRQLMFYFTLVSVVPLVLSGLLLVGMFRTRVHREFAAQDLAKQQLIEQRLSTSAPSRRSSRRLQTIGIFGKH